MRFIVGQWSLKIVIDTPILSDVFQFDFLQEHTKLEGHAVVKDPQNNSFLAKFSRPSPTFTG